jgi:hypothetical protein
MFPVRGLLVHRELCDRRVSLPERWPGECDRRICHSSYVARRGENKSQFYLGCFLADGRYREPGSGCGLEARGPRPGGLGHRLEPSPER